MLREGTRVDEDEEGSAGGDMDLICRPSEKLMRIGQALEYSVVQSGIGEQFSKETAAAAGSIASPRVLFRFVCQDARGGEDGEVPGGACSRGRPGQIGMS